SASARARCGERASLGTWPGPPRGTAAEIAPREAPRLSGSGQSGMLFCVPIGRADAERILGERGWLSKSPAAFRAEVLRRASVARFAAGDVVFRFGDPPGGIYGMVAGIVTITTAPRSEMPRFDPSRGPGHLDGRGLLRHARAAPGRDPRLRRHRFAAPAARRDGRDGAGGARRGAPLRANPGGEHRCADPAGCVERTYRSVRVLDAEALGRLA